LLFAAVIGYTASPVQTCLRTGSSVATLLWMLSAFPLALLVGWLGYHVAEHALIRPQWRSFTLRLT
jgi:hypothetical protein